MTGSLKEVTKALALCIAVLGLASGCVSAKKGMGEKAEMAAESEAPAPTEEVVEEKAMEEVEEVVENDSYTVKKDDNLWCISKQPEIYDTAFNWPLIFKENKDQIKDADLIFPDQVLMIPRDSSEDEITAAVNHAKSRGAWAVGPIEASDTAYVSN